MDINLLTSLSSYGKQINLTIKNGATTYTSDKIISFTPSFDGGILTSVMKQARIELNGIDSTADEMMDAHLNISLAVTGGGVTGARDFGTFIVKDAAYNDETDSIVLDCYDLMIMAMTEYKTVSDFSESVTLGSYLQSLCDDIGIPLATPTFTNSTVVIDGEKYDSSYTKRDVFTEIAQAAGGTIAIKDDSIHVLYPTSSGVTIDPSNLKSIEIGEMYGPVNSVVIARTPQEDNIYQRDDTAENICEIKIENNQLMDSHREDFIDGIYNSLYGLTYYPHYIESFGIGMMDVCDLFTVIDLKGNTYTCMQTACEMEITQGVSERTIGTVPISAETDYKSASKTDRVINKTILRVDKQQQEIQAFVTRTTNEINSLTGQVEDITRSVEQKITPEQVQIIISETIGEIDSITTSTGYTFGKDGLNIQKSGEEIENLINNKGVYVNRLDDNVLSADAAGVDAINLTARQYFIIGGNSRLEDYEGNRTACFYIGG